MEERKPRKFRSDASEKEEAKKNNRDRDDRSSEKDRSRGRHEKEKSDLSKYRDREMHKDRHREKDHERTKRSRGDERARAKSRGREKDAEELELDREREKVRDRDRDRDRARERERENEKERERRGREKKREMDKYNEKDKNYEMSRLYSSSDDDRDHGKRRRKEEDYKKRDGEVSNKQNQHRDDIQDNGQQKESREESVITKGNSREEDLAEEQKRLDEEMEKRRRRVQERERESEKERERKGREKKRERDKYNEKDKNYEMSRLCSSSDGDRDHGKRRRKEEDYKKRDGEVSNKQNQHRDDIQDNGQRKESHEELVITKGNSREEDLAEEQKRLDEEMEKRRRRVQEWQELRRKEELEMQKLGGSVNTDEPLSGKTWTLEGESDDEVAAPEEKSAIDEDDTVKHVIEDSNEMSTDNENVSIPALLSDNDHAAEDDEIDPLDAFMNSTVLPEVERLHNAVESPNNLGPDVAQTTGKQNSVQYKKGMTKTMGRIIAGEDSDSDYGDLKYDEDPQEDEDDEEFMKRVKKTKVEKLSIVDHSKIDYPPFRKNFYIEVKEINRMTSEEVAAYRKELELRIHGKDVPKPVKNWHQTGLSTKILDTIKKLNYEKPMPIQAQALPIIMSGRDCIGIAKTGSGKTLAFVLPMLRHIKDQSPLVPGDGPIGLIMAPTRELVQQIHSDIKKFAKVMALSCVPIYGGSGVAQQISDLKRGAEIVVCTPGRMIDILCTSGGKITNLRCVTYLVMDEADRMFDMGFEPQITRIVQNTRPDRQTVLFSATFPRQVEILARKVLNKPVELQVGGRSVVNKDITQLVEVRPESERFLRLLELLGEWYEKGKILIFVHTQDKCDALFKDLIRSGYPCLSLHGAKDQTDRESTITDFKSNVCNLLVATSIAARGLDVKELELVINFDVPNHYEDYVHRVGRTGRAGRRGCAITFVSEEDARYAPDLVKALELSEQSVPDDLKALANGFMAKVNQGLEQAHGTGYGGSGFKFNEEEDEVRKAAKKAQAKEYGFEEDKSDSEDEDEGVRKAGGDISHQAVLAQAAAFAAATKANAAPSPTPISAAQLISNGGLPGVHGLAIPGISAVVQGTGLPVTSNDAAARAAALAAAMNLQHNLAKIQADAMPEHYEAELEINDFPQNARWKVTHKETLGPISEWTGAAITTRGQFFPPGKVAGPGDRKLYLFIEGPTEQSVKRAKAELKRALEDITSHGLSLPLSAQPGRYSVV